MRATRSTPHWTPGPLIIIARRLLGVQVVAPASAEVVVAPHPSTLAHARGRMATVRGLVAVDIEQSPGYRVSVTLAGNGGGTLRWPCAGYDVSAFEVQGPSGALRPSLDGDVITVPLEPGTTTLAV